MESKNIKHFYHVVMMLTKPHPPPPPREGFVSERMVRKTERLPQIIHPVHALPSTLVYGYKYTQQIIMHFVYQRLLRPPRPNEQAKVISSANLETADLPWNINNENRYTKQRKCLASNYPYSVTPRNLRFLARNASSVFSSV